MKERAKSIIRAASAGSLFVGAANLASACAVCATGKEEALPAYYASTAIMSLLPLCMMGGIVYYVKKKSNNR